eukprot:scaffold2103_cov93-Skeletonema_marinoi.AAC.3
MPRGRVIARLPCQSGRVHFRVVVGGISIGRIFRLVRVFVLRHFVLCLLIVRIGLVGWMMKGARMDDYVDGCSLKMMLDVMMEE